MSDAINVLLISAPEDERLTIDLTKQLKPLVRNGTIVLLNEEPIQPGRDEVSQYYKRADSADIVLLLISKDMMASLDDDASAKRSLARHAAGQLRLIPVILRPVAWKADDRIGRLAPLPQHGRPIGGGSRAAQDQAMCDVVLSLKSVIQHVQTEKQKARIQKWHALQQDLLTYQDSVFSVLADKERTRTPPPTVNSPPESRRYTKGRALLIGVGADMPGTVNDARALHDLLTDSERAAYPREQVTLLTEETATRQRILDALDALKGETQADETVFLFFSGHGWQPDPAKPMCYLVPNDYFPRASATALISGQEFADRVLAIRSRKLLLFLDCCYAGAVETKTVIDSVPDRSVPIPLELAERMESGAGRVVVASSRPGEQSLAGLPYSVFTSCLLDALQARSKADEYIRLFDVLGYLFREVPLRSKGRQHPFLTSIAGMTEDLIICRARS